MHTKLQIGINVMQHGIIPIFKTWTSSVKRDTNYFFCRLFSVHMMRGEERKDLKKREKKRQRREKCKNKENSTRKLKVSPSFLLSHFTLTIYQYLYHLFFYSQSFAVLWEQVHGKKIQVGMNMSLLKMRFILRRLMNGQKHARHVAMNWHLKKCDTKNCKFISNPVHTCLSSLYSCIIW